MWVPPGPDLACGLRGNEKRQTKGDLSAKLTDRGGS